MVLKRWRVVRYYEVAVGGWYEDSFGPALGRKMRFWTYGGAYAKLVELRGIALRDHLPVRYEVAKR